MRYRDDFEDALIQLGVARSLLDDLENASSTSHDQAVAVLFADEIGPEIHYCAHELGRTKAYDVNGIVSELAPMHRNEIVENCDALIAKLCSEGSSISKTKLKERLWEGQPVPIRYPELVDVFLKVEQAESVVDSRQKEGRRSTSNKKAKSDVTAYDAVLTSLSDAEEVARKLQEAQQVSFFISNLTKPFSCRLSTPVPPQPPQATVVVTFISSMLTLSTSSFLDASSAISSSSTHSSLQEEERTTRQRLPRSPRQEGPTPI